MIYKEWRNQIKPEKRKRNYQHIDDPLDLDDEKIFRKVIHIIEDIKNHQFLPFIKREEIKVRFRRDKTGKARRSLKQRPIMYASHMDAHIYSYYNFLLINKYEGYIKNIGIGENVTAYRKVEIKETGKGKSNLHFAKDVFDHILTRDECIVITQDIESFFDNLNHRLLKEKICKINGVEKLDDAFYKVYRSLTSHKSIKYSDFVDKKIKRKTKNNKYAIYKALEGIVKENKTNKGIPQGSPISGLLANIYLVDFDNQIKTSFPDVFYRRYSDDLVFICRTDQKDAVLEFVNNKIKECLLKINSSKSYISFFEKNNNIVICKEVTNGLDEKQGRNYVDYLGLEFNGENTFLRKNTIQKLKEKQERKTTKQLANTQSQKRRTPLKLRKKKFKGQSNYFKKAVEVIDSRGVKKQVLKVSKSRNILKKDTRAV